MIKTLKNKIKRKIKLKRYNGGNLWRVFFFVKDRAWNFKDEYLVKKKNFFLRLPLKRDLISEGAHLLAGKSSRYYPRKMIMSGKLEIGSYCAIGENLRIIGQNHNYHLPAMQAQFYRSHFKEGYPGYTTKGKVIIGSDVWFGDNVSVLSGVKIGHGACIGVNAVVTKDVPPYAIAAGVPAQVIKFRFSPEVIEFLLQLRWWNWNEDRIKQNKEFFYSNLNQLSLAEIKQLIKD